MKATKKILILAGVLLAIIVLYFWSGYVFTSQFRNGDTALSARKYSLAYVYYQKAAMLRPANQTAKDRENLAKAAAEDITTMENFLADRKDNDLLAKITAADSKSCDLAGDQNLLNNNLPEVARVNLKFCTTDGPKNYNSWLLLGLADVQISQSQYLFAEMQPTFQKEAAAAFAEAYKIDPVNKTAIEQAIAINKILGNQSEVDHWQKILDDLNKISQ